MSDLDCREFVELVTSYLEGSMDAQAEQDFVDHLALCDGCERYLDQMRRTSESLAELPGDSIATDARSALLDAFRSRRG
ncbi:zf-HC2 domain-containing protein [Kribbella shirazensis]|uniref:Putative anti-sigma-YlaC factor YlaD n=1 Tax=Kribbella shirazensis TaxID=1105143 RepID=A0A7X5VER3_9ACTN|nr:putative anti-sigma-YlaC factor YlaD [Kribbella shirazensis]